MSVVGRLREMAGCTRLCSLLGGEILVMPRFRLRHNGVSFSRQADVDMYLMATSEEVTLEALAAWLRAHHAGDHRQPFPYDAGDGKTVLIPEAEGDWQVDWADR